MAPYLIMFAAGIGIPVLAALNAALGHHLGSAATAAVLLFTIGLLCAASVAILTGLQGFARIASAPRYLFIAGFFMAFYVLSITWAAPRIGVGNAIFLVLLGQLVCATALGHFSWLGALHAPVSLARLAGLALMTAGVFLTLKG